MHIHCTGLGTCSCTCVPVGGSRSSWPPWPVAGPFLVHERRWFSCCDGVTVTLYSPAAIVSRQQRSMNSRCRCAMAREVCSTLHCLRPESADARGRPGWLAWRGTKDHARTQTLLGSLTMICNFQSVIACNCLFIIYSNFVHNVISTMSCADSNSYIMSLEKWYEDSVIRYICAISAVNECITVTIHYKCMLQVIPAQL